MLKSQKLALRASEIRTKLAEHAGSRGRPGRRGKVRDCQAANRVRRRCEVRYQAAVTSEDVRETETTDTAEGREYRALVDTAELGEIYGSRHRASFNRWR